MKTKWTILFLLFLPLFLKGQTNEFKRVPDAEKNILINEIMKVTETTKSLKCDFLQEKQLSFLKDIDKSTGIMYYKSPKSLKWEYIYPSKFYFAFHRDKIFVGDEKGKSSYNTGSHKAFRMLSEMIVGFVSGKSLQDNENFKMEYYKNSKHIQVKMIPESKEMKKMVKEVSLYLDIKTYLADHIVMTDINGDITRFYFSNIQRNITIGDELFNIK